MSDGLQVRLFLQTGLWVCGNIGGVMICNTNKKQLVGKLTDLCLVRILND